MPYHAARYSNNLRISFERCIFTITTTFCFIHMVKGAKYLRLARCCMLLEIANIFICNTERIWQITVEKKSFLDVAY